MRSTYDLWRHLEKGLKKHLKGADIAEGLGAKQICEVELGLYLLSQIAPKAPARALWVLLTGYDFPLPELQHLNQKQRNMWNIVRHILLHFKNARHWEEMLERYGNVDERLRLYEVDGNNEHFTQRIISIEAKREEVYSKIAQLPLPHVTRKVRWAEAGNTYLCADKRKRNHVTIAADMPLPSPPQGHNLCGQRSRPPIPVPWNELLSIAQWMDDQLAQGGYPKRDWHKTMLRVRLHISQDENSEFVSVDALDTNANPSSRERRAERLRMAIRQRIEEISDAIPQVNGRAAALIELDPAQAFGEVDPKYALRIGFAQMGWLTQFITPYKENKRLPEKQRKKEEEKVIYRANAAMRDLLRQCGVLGVVPQIMNKGKATFSPIPSPLHYLGVWLIKQYSPSSHTHIPQMLPLVVHMASDTDDAYVKVRGFTDWLSYADTLLALAKGQAQGIRKPKDALPFIMDTLNRFIPTCPHTMLFFHAQNFRTAWSWLSNEQITKGLPAPFSKYKHLRIVRVRTGEHETPEWYAQSEDVRYGFAKGIFMLGESGYVFASIQEKPPTTQNLSKELSKGMSRTKIDKEGNRKDIAPNPTIAAWNPSIVEMTVSCAEPNEALMCATVADELRHAMASHYNHPTVYPFPLHLASLIEEYVLPLEEIEENDIW